MKKILVGTHNKGKFKEIAYLISKKYKKISPVSLKIKSPKETGKSFKSNSKLKVNYFSKFVDYSVISDDSGLCIKALNNKPGIYSARLANKYGGFFKAMKFILKKMEKVKNFKPISYSVVKSSMLGITKYISTYWAHKNVRCNTLIPGAVLNNQPKELIKNVIKRVPLRRWADVKDYQGALVFLASEASSYMTGQELIIDGGRSVW